MTEVKIAPEDVGEKLELLFNKWDREKNLEGSPWAGKDAILFFSGKNISDEADESSKLIYVQLWLTGFLFPDTLFVFTRDRKVYIVSSAKKINHLQQIKDCFEGLNLITRTTEGESNIKGTEVVVQHLKSLAEDKTTPKICQLKTEPQKGNVAAQWEKTFEFCDSSQSDTLFSEVMAIRTAVELTNQKLSATSCCVVLKNVLIHRIEQILDNEEQETHESIVNRVEKSLLDLKLTARWKEKHKIDASELEFIYSIVQSGMNFELKLSARPSSKNLSQSGGSILVAIGSKYAQVPSNIARTILLNAKDEQKEVYTFALSVFKECVKNVRVGVTFGSVYEKTCDFIKEKRPGVLSNFSKNVGHCMCAEFRDRTLVLCEGNEKTVQCGMVLNVSIGFSKLSCEGKEYAIWLADTVMVPRVKGESVVVLTCNVSKELEHVSYELEEEEGQSGSESENSSAKRSEVSSAKKKKKKESANANISTEILQSADSVILSDRLRRRKNIGENEAEDRDKRQLTLRRKKLEEIRQKYGGDEEGWNMNDMLKKKNVKKLDSINCFSDCSKFPNDIRTNKIYVDSKSESVFVPINGTHVPFHVTTLKNVTCTPEESQRHHTLRINFQVPGNQSLVRGEDNPLPELLDQPAALYVKELLFRTEDGRSLQAIYRNIKELIKRVKQKETEQDVARDLADQAKLILNRNSKRIVLKDLLVRPNVMVSKKVVGFLEGHTNGFRYQLNSRTGQNDVIDITYANIKSAIFQPCERELIVLIHLHLKSPIMVGKKKTYDVQFYSEVGTQIDDLSNRRKNDHDPDEMQEELRERETRRKYNQSFKLFVQQIEEMANIEFDVPYRELLFYGVALKSNSEIIPTASCLVHLVEWPPFVLSLEDIELVSFERVYHGLRNFDMCFIFQDYSKPVRQISSIPTEYLDNLKRWLNELEIVWYENKNNLSWSLIMKTIRDDIQGFAEMGGFETILGDGRLKKDKKVKKQIKAEGAEGNEENEEEEEEADDYDTEDTDDDDEDEAYAADSSGDADSAESSSSDSDDESLADEEDSKASDSNSEANADDDDEEGLSWDELEERAKAEDMKRTYEGDDRGAPNKKSRKR